MEFLRAGEVLSRSSQPLLPFLAPAAYRSPRRLELVSRHCKPQQWQCQHSRRTFASSHTLRQHTGDAARKEEDPPQASSSSNDDFFGLLDSALDRDRKGTPAAPTARATRYSSPSAQRSHRTESTETASAIDELIAGISIAQPRQKAARPPPNASNSKSPDFKALYSLLDPANDVASKLNPPARDPPPQPFLPQPSPIKLDSTVGRTIAVAPERGIDVGRAFRMLDMRCAQNSVRRDFQRQRFYERPGLKRKRLKSERWRKRFKESFQKTVGLVVRLKGQGW